MEKTYFIAFEGIDGSGKDTQINKLVETIKKDDDLPFGNKYSNILITREPTKITKPGTTIAKLIREKNVSGEQATKLYILDRIKHSKIIRKQLKFCHVLTSRYDLSTFLYQYTQGMNFNLLYKKHRYNKFFGARIPDITIVFKITAKIAQERTNKRKSIKECFETKSFQEKLEKNLDIIIEKIRKKDNRTILIINANKTIEEVTKEMIKKISIFINKDI